MHVASLLDNLGLKDDYLLEGRWRARLRGPLLTCSFARRLTSFSCPQVPSAVLVRRVTENLTLGYGSQGKAITVEANMFEVRQTKTLDIQCVFDDALTPATTMWISPVW